MIFPSRTRLNRMVERSLQQGLLRQSQPDGLGLSAESQQQCGAKGCGKRLLLPVRPRGQ